MPKIIKLDSHLTNLIAAGEVIEKVSSVVKELVENSIDANSTEIEVNLLESGIKEIIVIDNGQGMEKEDIKMSFIRHATSKIKNQYDLYHINTLGFRGEAIPSIASVSDITIISNDNNLGYYVNYRFSNLIREGVEPLNKGTKVIVKDLFHNTPARLKYLKSFNVELGSIMEIMDRFALANSHIRFKVTNDKKVILQTKGNQDVTELMSNVYGNEVGKNLLSFSEEISSFTLDFYLVKPFITKSRKSSITLIVNGRSVRNSNIINAIVEGYDTYIPNGRYPVALLFISVDPMLIDVNVHPAKTEIKFSSEDELIRIIKQVIGLHLKESNFIPSYKKIIEKEHYQPLIKEEISLPFTNVIVEEDKSQVEQKIPYLEYIGQYAGTYLIMQNEEALYLIDQHAAMERVNYEYYLEKLGNPNSEYMELLIPIDIEVTKKEMIYILDNLNAFRILGILVEQSGEQSIFIRQVPLWIIGDIEEVVEEIVIFLIKNQVVNLEKIRDELAKSISCKKAIKANHFIDSKEVKELLTKLNRCENPYTCPHGRPTIVKLTTNEIEKMFFRIL